MKMKKAPGELVDLITHIMEGVDCERRVMFGFPVYFMNRNMFAGLFEDKVFFRLSVEQRRSLESKAGPVLNLEPMPGRAMKDYWVVPPKIVSDPVKLRSLAAAGRRPGSQKTRQNSRADAFQRYRIGP